MILALFCAPGLIQAQSNAPLSSQVEELLKHKREKKEREQAIVDKIGKDAFIEKLQEEQRAKIEQLKKEKLSQAIKKRFAPKSPFLNFRPLESMLTWTSTLSYSKDSFEEKSNTVTKDLSSNHLLLTNRFEYSWSKKILLRYENFLTVNQSTKNTKRLVNGAEVNADPEIGSSKFGDHIFEVNYRHKREIFYNYDLDYFFKLVYPFGEATRSYAFGPGGENEASSTTASQKGNLKSAFSFQPRVGLDYFSGVERSRYNIGGSLGYAMKGKYVRNKGTGFWSTSASGLIVKTESYLDFDLWLRYQKRPTVLKKVFYGLGVNAYYSLTQEEKILTTGSDGLSYDQKNKLQPFLKINGDFWLKYMLKEMEHIEVGLKIFAPYTTEVKSEILDEGADSGGNRVINNSQVSLKTKHSLPYELRVGYTKSF